jgi:hypothetical protein
MKRELIKMLRKDFVRGERALQKSYKKDKWENNFDNIVLIKKHYTTTA